MRRRAFANQVLTWIKLMLVISESMIFSPLVGYGLRPCSFSQSLRVLVVSRVAFLRLEMIPYGPRRLVLLVAIEPSGCCC